MNKDGFTDEDIDIIRAVDKSIREFKEHCRDEYGIELENIISSKDNIRLAQLTRLSGIMMKKKYADKKLRYDPEPILHESKFGKYAWIWNQQKLEDAVSNPKNSEDKLIMDIMNDQNYNSGQFVSDFSHERSFFKVILYWYKDKKSGNSRPLSELLEVPETPEEALLLDILNTGTHQALKLAVGKFTTPGLAASLLILTYKYGKRLILEDVELEELDKEN